MWIYVSIYIHIGTIIIVKCHRRHYVEMIYFSSDNLADNTQSWSIKNIHPFIAIVASDDVGWAFKRLHCLTFSL